MNNLTDTEAQIIAILEEAGEEGLGTLINTVTTGSGSSDEIEAIAFALKVLLDRDLIQVAESRDKGSLQWHPLSKEESLVMLKNLMPFFQWSGTDKVWTLRECARCGNSCYEGWTENSAKDSFRIWLGLLAWEGVALEECAPQWSVRHGGAAAITTAPPSQSG
jgi:hypothetical protein